MVPVERTFFSDNGPATIKLLLCGLLLPLYLLGSLLLVSVESNAGSNHTACSERLKIMALEVTGRDRVRFFKQPVNVVHPEGATPALIMPSLVHYDKSVVKCWQTVSSTQPTRFSGLSFLASKVSVFSSSKYRA